MNPLESLARLRSYGLVEMSAATGKWEPSRKGWQAINDFRLLMELGDPDLSAAPLAAREEHSPRGMMSGSTRAGRRREGTR